MEVRTNLFKKTKPKTNKKHKPKLVQRRGRRRLQALEALVTHANRLLQSLNASLEKLTPRQQKIFALSRLNGRSYLEIAEQLGVSASTVQKELKLIMAICVEVAARLERR